MRVTPQRCKHKDREVVMIRAYVREGGSQEKCVPIGRMCPDCGQMHQDCKRQLKIGFTMFTQPSSLHAVGSPLIKGVIIALKGTA
jgi:hypothetical protein